PVYIGVLRKTAGGRVHVDIEQPVHGIGGRGDVSGGNQSIGELVHVARPDEVVAARVVVAFRRAPGGADPGDHRAVAFVLHRLQRHRRQIILIVGGAVLGAEAAGIAVPGAVIAGLLV